MSVDDHDEDITMGEEQKFCCTHDGCGKSYKQKRNLMIHVKLDHCDPSEMRLYECSEEGCGRVFKYKCALNRHNILYHMGPEIREAHLCKRRKNQEPKVLDPNEDKRWRVLVGAVESDPDSKLFQCCHESCNRVFTSKGSLKLHLQRKHDTPGLFTCPVETCARQFSYKHVLQTHIERVHHMPFDYTAFPNPKRQRTPRKVSALAQAANQLLEGSQNDSVEAGNYQDSDLDSEDDEPAAKLIKTATKAAKAAENEAGASSSSVGRSTRGNAATALGNLADMAARSATLGTSPSARANEQLPFGLQGTANTVAAAGGVVHMYECDFPGCNKVFSWKGSLALHQDRIHKMPDSYQCPVEDCYKTFSYKHVLQQHLRRVHKLDSINN
eukprot:gene8578-10164_t